MIHRSVNGGGLTVASGGIGRCQRGFLPRVFFFVCVQSVFFTFVARTAEQLEEYLCCYQSYPKDLSGSKYSVGFLDLETCVLYGGLPVVICESSMSKTLISV